ncbi:uncharacterized protein [Montipora foliosa]|uniref:uncharacterized protein n=1 Tax=Montipora foliosa TaxID=591990 RepID=UPI0035F1B29C
MAVESGTTDRAKVSIKDEEYEQIRIELEKFSKTASMESLCSSLFKLLNSPSLVSILAEVRDCLPKSQRNKFIRCCNDLLKSQAIVRNQQRQIESKILYRDQDIENNPPNFEGSPAKRKKKTYNLRLNSKTEIKGLHKGQEEKNPEHVRDRNSKSFIPRYQSKIVVLQRDSLKERFGFMIRGGDSCESSITIYDVTRGSLAERQGLKRGDQLIKLNDRRCGKRGKNICELIRTIKTAKVLHMQITSSNLRCTDARDVELFQKERNKPGEKSMLTVMVYPSEDGWLGCWVRGGVDYACAVHIISVDADSPAESAGLKEGDIIVAINGIRTKDLTHVQVVKLVITSGSLIRFSLKRGSKPTRKSSRHQLQKTGNVLPTPLRTQCKGSHKMTCPSSPSFKQLDPPMYSYSHHREAEGSPSQLPINSLTLHCLPPPPYTPVVPSQHRVLARGQQTPCQRPQDTTHVMTQQFTPREQGPQGLNSVKNTQGAQFSIREPISQQQEDSDSLEELPVSSVVHKQQESHGILFEQELQCSCHEDIAMQVIDVGEELPNNVSDDKENINLKESMSAMSQEGLISKQKNVLTPISLQQEKVMSFEDLQSDRSLPPSNSASPENCNGVESFLSHQIQQVNNSKLRRLSLSTQRSIQEVKSKVNEFTCEEEEDIQVAADNCRSPAEISKSPPPVNGRESFLSQIQQFNKAKLRTLSQCPSTTSPEDCLQSKQRKASYNQDDLEPEDVKHDGQKCFEAGTLFAALKQVLHHRARVMHDTITSADEFDTSSDSSCDDITIDDWDL